MQKKIKYSIFIFFIFLLIVPAIQTFNIIKIKPLDGAYYLTEQPVFSIKSWLSGEYQEKLNRHVEDHIGFRSYFVKLRNEFDFLFFSLIHANGVVLGNNNVLYQRGYIDAYLGNDFIGDDVIKRNLFKLEFIQKELQKKGITIITIFAPGKVSIYPEFVPSKYHLDKKKRTNYEAYMDNLKNRRINFIDLRDYFLKIKDTTKYLLFPKCGTHWSGYAITLVADTLFKYIENISDIKLNHFQSKPGYFTKDSFRFTDNDIGKGLNLLFDIPSEVYYPNIIFSNDSTKNKPDILSIGDSFNQSFWGFYPFFSNMFGSNSQYWNYNKILAWPDSLESKYINTENLDYKKEIEKRKIILLVTTELNYDRMGFSFIDQVYNIYCPKIRFEERMASTLKSINSDTNYYNQIKLRASERNISIENMMYVQSKWIINTEEIEYDKTLHSIYNNKGLYSILSDKASKYQINIDLLVQKYCDWFIQNEKNLHIKK